jgi:hypothetical protein
MNTQRPRLLHQGNRAETERSTYDTAQVCVNGHVINASAASSPEFNQKFCDKCGLETLTSCPECNAPIKGHLRGSLAINYNPPKFCGECGKAFAWTSRALQTARMYADELDKLSPGDRELLKGSLDELLKDTPATPLAASRFKKLLEKAGPGALECMKKIVIDLLTEAAKTHFALGVCTLAGFYPLPSFGVFA